MTSSIVIGAGAFGSAIARRLARDGHDVVLVEQREPGWAGSSSSGESRLLRCAHGAGAGGEWYARSAWRARELWREAGTDLFSERGLAWFARGDASWEDGSERVLAGLGIPAERLDPAEAERLFPELGTADVDWVLFEPGGGVVRAERAVRRLADQAVEAGTRLVQARARPDHGLPVVDGERLDADHVIWACGPWLGGLFPDLVQLRVTRQEVFFFASPPEWRDAPGWVDYEASAYGHGDLDGHGFKASSDAEGADADPDALLDAAPGCAEAVVRAYLARRFPPLASAPLALARPCPYELTADTHFVAAPHPQHERVWLVGGGSGHGFKHAPVLAEHVADLVGGRTAPDPRFGTAPRMPDRSLRTAGVRATPLGKKLRRGS